MHELLRALAREAARAAIYARYSSDLQRDASVEDQIHSCTDYAKTQGLEVVSTYSDRAISGASLMRSGMQALLRDARGGPSMWLSRKPSTV